MESAVHSAPEREVLWLDTTPALVPALAAVGSGPLAVDTEADSFHHYREKVCLIQLSFGTTDALIDPLAGLDLAPVRSVLGEPSIRKVFHGGDYDVRLLLRDAGIEVRGLFDTMVAARLAGETAFGLATLLEKHFGVVLDKRWQRADWSERPLPEPMVRYAALDTRHLIELAARLETRLGELGRLAWAEEEFRRIELARFSDAPPPEPWRRFRELATLAPRQLAVLRELARWREAEAERRDVPPFRVLRDENLLATARFSPRAVDELSRGRVVPESWAAGERARELVAAVERGLTSDPASWPRLDPQDGRRRRPPRDDRLRCLCRARDRLAVGLGLDPALVAPRATLERVLEALDAGRALSEIEELRDWQRALLQPLLE